jgi:hypoxanthine phosphoribosyltransferase
MCQQSAEKLLADFQPQLLIAIGGGGYVPARILRSFLKRAGSPNIPIQAIGLSLYESLGNDEVEAPGTKVTRTQWLDLTALGEMQNLVGKRILIVDEVDDTRTTLEYAVKELEKDVEIARQRMGDDAPAPKTEFSIFVLHVCSTVPNLLVQTNKKQNKDKPKKGKLPDDMLATRYSAAETVGDVWINYPWEAIDIDEHDRNASLQAKSN